MDIITAVAILATVTVLWAGAGLAFLFHLYRRRGQELLAERGDRRRLRDENQRLREYLSNWDLEPAQLIDRAPNVEPQPVRAVADAVADFHRGRGEGE